jgi:hypothetical protein
MVMQTSLRDTNSRARASRTAQPPCPEPSRPDSCFVLNTAHPGAATTKQLIFPSGRGTSGLGTRQATSLQPQRHMIKNLNKRNIEENTNKRRHKNLTAKHTALILRQDPAGSASYRAIVVDAPPRYCQKVDVRMIIGDRCCLQRH